MSSKKEVAVIEITQRELDGYKNTQVVLSGLLKGENGAIITKCNIKNEEDFTYRLDIPNAGDYDSFQAMYDRLLVAYIRVQSKYQTAHEANRGLVKDTIVLEKAEENALEMVEDFREALTNQEKAYLSNENELRNEIGTLELEIKRLEKRNWFHKLFNL